jgi:hypothetical protein
MATTLTIQDPTNNPALVIINGITLPGDVIITTSDEKTIAETVILDGAVVFEHIRRKPKEINFDFKFREINTGQYANAQLNAYVFPQQQIETFLENTWELDQILSVTNTYLNGMGINNIIFKSMTQTTIRGNTDVICSIKALEVYGSIIQPQSLIIVPTGD